MRRTLRPRGGEGRRAPLSGRSTIPSRQPVARRWRAMARPIPFAPPVTRATGLVLGMECCQWLVAFDRKVGARAPFRPGAVVETLRLLAERFKRESQNRGGDAGAAARNDRLVEVDA